MARFRLLNVLFMFLRKTRLYMQKPLAEILSYLFRDKGLPWIDSGTTPFLVFSIPMFYHHIFRKLSLNLKANIDIRVVVPLSSSFTADIEIFKSFCLIDLRLGPIPSGAIEVGQSKLANNCCGSDNGAHFPSLAKSMISQN